MNRRFDFLGQRPIVIAIAGSNGAGKSTFYHSHLRESGLRFINADVIAAELQLDAYEAASVAASIRDALIDRRESFIFETVLSDPIGDKVQTLKGYTSLGYTVALIFIKIDDASTSIQRVSMRVREGGHDVPDEKLKSRFDRTQANLARAIESIPNVLVYDNTDLSQPYQLIDHFANGKRIRL